MKKAFLLATGNSHKVQEIKSILGPEFEYFTLRDFPGAPTAVEDAPDFAGNATKKAVALASWVAAQPSLFKPDYILADDSGLEVDALNGAPGIHSARFAALDSETPGPRRNSPDHENNAKLLRLLAKVPPEKRTARFRCTMALTRVPAPAVEIASPVCEANEAELGTEIFQGTCEGRILEAPRGAHGFGYDPLFVPNSFTQTFAELGEETKNSMSHRGNALKKLRTRLVGRF
jgi:XTP/dITP diphosphohydrolase